MQVSLFSYYGQDVIFIGAIFLWMRVLNAKVFLGLKVSLVEILVILLSIIDILHVECLR